MRGEFDLIRKYFYQRQMNRNDVHLALGDDCAIVKSPKGVRLVISTDTLVEGTHFVAGANPAWIAHKALASNLSDLAAMGGTPAWCSLALTLPEVHEPWLQSFCDAFFRLADEYDIQLIGGDTTKGPLSISLTVHGFVPEDNVLLRTGAAVGDWVYVTGCLGDSKAGLELILSDRSDAGPDHEILEERHYLSAPRVLAGQALLGIASSAIDISDGLVSDIRHIAKASGVGVSIDVSQLPVSEVLLQYLNDDLTLARQYALTSGEEYELCFTVPQEKTYLLDGISRQTHTQFTCIGQVNSANQIVLHDQGQPLPWTLSGYDHFKVNE
ncbi:Thiamine-monophosphate kinase [Vibrio aerogenes CECT 7868]|uniref:Thiamine-monophosphate kinase n=1 Tax=Vibrio aerogenes CECT 7868 TaxID=1216006 RepID=A0A1M5WI43_9VIBR|nr:thiamine-phosphate kinase [Vibrio aerogenes]SHH87087.1 Thiamine-monophosphate kinase [Vibrio aerogenes CECT 7868]